MKLSERLNVLIQAVTMSQKCGTLSLDDAVKAKCAIDVISSGNINQNYVSAINTLIEIAVATQKTGVYSLKDAHMIYLAVENIESEFQNEINMFTKQKVEKNDENVVTIPSKKLKRNS